MIRAAGVRLGRAALVQLRGAALGLCLFPAQGLAEAGARTSLASLAPLARSMEVVDSTGPAIRVASPEGFALTSPVDFDIRIEPRGEVPVAMQTLRIDYRIGPLWKDITGHVTRHGRIDGTRLVATGTDLPKGRHTVRITVTDAEARKTVAIVKFAVR